MGGGRSGNLDWQVAEVYSHLGGVGAWNKICSADEVEETLVGEPPAAVDHFVAHHGYVGSRSAEADDAELEATSRRGLFRAVWLLTT